ncbi:biliverdin-producing heme oxygenase [Solimonas fluminis]|uniref:Biliverdin-producing heme oxygenase n=1 Tax=Solimonas fluminis TaxID=2086571 RepID=A0A2S5TAB1_9GAMM|nr:biliverdin-producing heme oxygenase [Solimonas fluminis]PPE71941.1 biliverdin-producing heme oxygenase [Solimonas fluminis]
MDVPTLSAPALRSRSAALSAATDDLHEALHDVVAAAAPFASRGHFTRWVTVQHRFQREIEPLYRIAGLQDWLPDLANRGRLGATAADLADLGAALPAGEPPAHDTRDHVAALGWLFVSEGSTLGAAMLFKKAQTLGLSEHFGARHLAAAPEGRARHWKQFTEALDRLELSAPDDARMREAARAAFRRFDVLLREAFALPA